MKIASRPQAQTGQTETIVLVQSIAIDSVMSSRHHANVMPTRSFFMEVVIRIPLADDEVTDLPRLRERIQNMHYAKLLETK